MEFDQADPGASGRTFDPRARRRNIIAAIATLSAGSTIYGMSMPLLSLVLEAQGVSNAMIGLSATAQAAAVFLIAPLVSRSIRVFGPARSLLTVLLLMAALFVLLAAFPNVWAWFPLRFLLGGAGSAFWIIGEAWINQVAEDRSRGRVLSFNSMAVSAGFALGPLVLAQLGSQGWTPFLFLAALCLVTVIPVASAMRVAPVMEGKPSLSLFAFLLRAPVPVLISGLYAGIDGVLLTFLPIYALGFGVPEGQSLMLITALGIGGIVGQLPFGWLVDAVDRYLLITVSVILMTLGTGLIPLVLDEPIWGLVHFLVFGAIHGGVYTAGLAILGQQFQGADLAAGSTAFGVAWGAGIMAGPALGGIAMRAVPEIGVPLCVGLFLVAYLPFPSAAVLRRLRDR